MDVWSFAGVAVVRCRRLTGPLTSLLLRETHCSKWAEMEAEQLSRPMRDLWGQPQPFLFSETTYSGVDFTGGHSDCEALVEDYLRAFDLPVLRDPFSLSVRAIPPPTYWPVPSNSRHSSAVDANAASAAAAAGLQQEQHMLQQSVKCQEAEQSTANQSCCTEQLEQQQHCAQQQQYQLLFEGGQQHAQSDTSLEDPSEDYGMEQQQHQEVFWGPKGLVDGRWFLGGTFGPASIVDVSGVMRAGQRGTEEAEQPIDDILPLPLKFLQRQVFFELNGDDDMRQGAGEAATLTRGGCQVTPSEAAFDTVGLGREGGTLSSFRAVKGRWQYLLQRTQERFTGLPVIPRRLPENDAASAAARAARQRPWCQRRLESEWLWRVRACLKAFSESRTV